MIILDFGSGETFKNDFSLIKKAIDEIAESAGEFKSSIVLKWQLFTQMKDGEKDLLPLMPHLFAKAYEYAKTKGIITTASVFDPESLGTLLKFPIPFVKLANNIGYHYLSTMVPRGLPIYWSVGHYHHFIYLHENYDNRPKRDVLLACVSKYPATIAEYEMSFIINMPGQKQGEIIKNDDCLHQVSDHTVGLDLFNKYHPFIWEKHFKLEGMNHCQDCGDFAITPQQLTEVFKKWMKSL